MERGQSRVFGEGLEWNFRWPAHQFAVGRKALDPTGRKNGPWKRQMSNSIKSYRPQLVRTKTGDLVYVLGKVLIKIVPPRAKRQFEPRAPPPFIKVGKKSQFRKGHHAATLGALATEPSMVIQFMPSSTGRGWTNKDAFLEGRTLGGKPRYAFGGTPIPITPMIQYILFHPSPRATAEKLSELVAEEAAFGTGEFLFALYDIAGLKIADWQPTKAFPSMPARVALLRSETKDYSRVKAASAALQKYWFTDVKRGGVRLRLHQLPPGEQKAFLLRLAEKKQLGPVVPRRPTSQARPLSNIPPRRRPVPPIPSDFGLDDEDDEEMAEAPLSNLPPPLPPRRARTSGTSFQDLSPARQATVRKQIRKVGKTKLSARQARERAAAEVGRGLYGFGHGAFRPEFGSGNGDVQLTIDELQDEVQELRRMIGSGVFAEDFNMPIGNV